jgi:hypothetical protein
MGLSGIGKRALACASALAVGVCLSVGADGAEAGVRGQRIGVPAYWAPDAAGSARFDVLAQAAPTVDVVVVNGPANGVPTPFDAATATQIRKLRDAGVTVLGYVDTGYLGRTGLGTSAGSTRIADWRAQADREAAGWFALYGEHGLAGVFLDQVTATCGTDDVLVDAYHRIADRLRERTPDAFVALNPGTGADECYAEVGDTMVVFENTYQAYRSWSPPEWVSRHPARSFWHLVYDAPTTTELRDAVNLAKQRNAGYVYVTADAIHTTGSPWDTVPAADYWYDEVCQVRLRR